MTDLTQHVRCNGCQRTLPVTAFGTRPSRGPHAIRKPCLGCRRLSYRAADPISRRAAELRRHYGMTLVDYDRILASQGGVCAICGSDSPGGRSGVKSFMVDHDHGCCPTRGSCGKCVRGLLCVLCNRLVGRFESQRGNEVLRYIENHAPRRAKP